MFTPKMNLTNTEILQNVWKFKLHPQQVFQIHKIYTSNHKVRHPHSVHKLTKSEAYVLVSK